MLCQRGRACKPRPELCERIQFHKHSLPRPLHLQPSASARGTEDRPHPMRRLAHLKRYPQGTLCMYQIRLPSCMSLPHRLGTFHRPALCNPHHTCNSTNQWNLPVRGSWQDRRCMHHAKQRPPTLRMCRQGSSSTQPTLPPPCSCPLYRFRTVPRQDQSSPPCSGSHSLCNSQPQPVNGPDNRDMCLAMMLQSFPRMYLRDTWCMHWSLLRS